MDNSNHMGLNQLEEAAFLEKQGKIEEAIAIYNQFIERTFLESLPYDRLRILYSKQKKWKKAIEVCESYVKVIKSFSKNRPYKKACDECEHWIRRYRYFLAIEIGEYLSSNAPTEVQTADKILQKSIEGSSERAKKTHVQSIFEKNKPKPYQYDLFPSWVVNRSLTVVEVPLLHLPGANLDALDFQQKKFYSYWKENWKAGTPLDVKGNIPYLFLYAQDVIFSTPESPSMGVSELRRLQRVYEHETYFLHYLDQWIRDLYILNSDFTNAIAFLVRQQDKQKYITFSGITLSLKYKLGYPLLGSELLSLLHNRPRREETRDNLGYIRERLSLKILEIERKYNIDLLALITEKFASPVPAFGLFGGMAMFPSKYCSFDCFDYSYMPEFQGVILTWLREAENDLREKSGLPHVGEGWVNETRLYNIINKHFGALGYEVIHHAFPLFLGRQELDIHIPALNVGIEFNGRQHYDAVDYFGGKEALSRQIARDERKRRLCKENGVTLIEFKFDEPIEEKHVISKIVGVVSPT